MDINLLKQTLYQLYMEDAVLEAENEMNLYVEAVDKEDVYKINYYLRDHLQIPYVTNLLSKQKTRDAILEFTGKFIDEHSYQLSTAGPVHSFTFKEKEISFFYDLFQINTDKLLELYNQMVIETFYGKISLFYNGWVKHAPHKLLFTAILIESIQKDYTDMIECCEYLWAFCEYPIIYRIYFKTGVKEDVMNYTIEHLSSKFKIKVNNLNNLKQLLKYDAHSSVLSQIEKLKTGADHSYTDFMQRMRNQINSTFKNISHLYFENNEKNASQHTNTSQFDDGSLADQEGIMTNISQTVDNTVNKFISNGIINPIAKIVAENSQVDKDNLLGYINQILNSKDNKIYKFIENIITIYFNRNPTDLSPGSSEFLNFGLSLFRSLSGSKDELYQELKVILQYWMNDIINISQFYQRPGTISAYSRAIFNYMIFIINYYN